MRLLLFVTVAGLSCFPLGACGTTEVQAESGSRPSPQVVRGDINTALLITLCKKIDHLIGLIKGPRPVSASSGGYRSGQVKMAPIKGSIVNYDNETKLAVINVGANGGVECGYVLDVTRGGSYIALLVIDTVYDNAAAGTIRFITLCESVRCGDVVSNIIQ